MLDLRTILKTQISSQETSLQELEFVKIQSNKELQLSSPKIRLLFYAEKLVGTGYSGHFYTDSFITQTVGVKAQLRLKVELFLMMVQLEF